MDYALQQNLSTTNLFGTRFCVTGVQLIQVKLKKISYIGTLFEIVAYIGFYLFRDWFMQDLLYIGMNFTRMKNLIPSQPVILLSTAYLAEKQQIPFL